MKTYTFVIRIDNGIDLDIRAENEEDAREQAETHLVQNRQEIMEQLVDAGFDGDPCIHASAGALKWKQEVTA